MKHALRSLARTPGFTAIALLTLALGIGVNTAMFSIVHTLLFKSAPYPDSARLIRVFRTTPQSQSSWHSAADLVDLRAQNTSFENLAWFDWSSSSLAEPGQPAERVPGLIVGAEFFATLHVQPLLGRCFSADECVEGHSNVVVLSHSFWQRRFGGDPAVIGRTVRIDSTNVTVIGVMGEGVDYPVLWGRVDLWRPLALSSEELQNRRSHWLHAIARLKPAVSFTAARTELAALSARWAKDFPDTNADRGFRIVALHESAMDALGRNLSWLLLGLSGFVLLIACANLANLQLARTAIRSRDYAIRSALGASRARLMRELLVESLLLAGAGGLLGLLLAQWVTDFIAHRALAGSDRTLVVALDPTVLAFALSASLATGVLFGLMPAWAASKSALNAVLQRQSRGSTGDRSQHRLRNALIVAQVGFALILLTGSGFFIRGLQRALSRDLGWDRAHVLTASLSLPRNHYDTDDKLIAFYPQLLERLRSISGVEHAAIASSLPVGTYNSSRGVIPEGPPPPPPAQAPAAFHVYTSPDFFNTLGVQLVQGRFFPDNLRADSPHVAIVNEALARQFWPGENPIGKRIGSARPNERDWTEVIGVVRDIGFAGEFSEPRTRLQVYLPLTQNPGSDFQIAIRTTSSPATLANSVRQVIAGIDPELPADDVQTVGRAVELRTQNFELTNQLLIGFAGLGLLLTLIGLYGVISNLVVQRTSEFGIRLALGARPTDVLRLVMGQGVRLAALGTVLGLAGSLALFRLFAAAIPIFPGQDWLLVAVTVAGLLAVALFACWIPARRATRVDPVIALRAE